MREKFFFDVDEAKSYHSHIYEKSTLKKRGQKLEVEVVVIMLEGKERTNAPEDSLSMPGWLVVGGFFAGRNIKHLDKIISILE